MIGQFLPVMLTAATLVFAAYMPATAQRVTRSAKQAEAAKAETDAQAAIAAQREMEERAYSLPEIRNMAKEAHDAGDVKRLVFALEKWIAFEPSRFDIRLELGAALMKQKKYPEAISTLKTASAMIPSDEAPHRLLAQIYAAQGLDSLRYSHLVSAVKLAPRNYENQYHLGSYYASTGKIDEGIKLLERSMELNGGFAPAKFRYARIMLDKGDLEEAFGKFGEATFADPENALYHAYYAYAASVTRRWSTARESIAEALRLGPNNVEALCLASQVYLFDGNNREAERHARTAQRISPNSMRALEALGDVFAADFKYKEACGAYMTVWQKAGYREDLVSKLGTALALDGKWKEAKALFEDVAAKKPADGEALYRLTEVYIELGDIKKANATIERDGFGNNRDNRVWHLAAQARLYEAQNKPDQARKAYRAAYKTDENNPRVNAGLGRRFMDAAAFDSAMVFFQTANKFEPQNIRHLLAMATIHEARDEFDDALSIYEQIVARNPGLMDIYMTMASISESRGDLTSAISYVNRALRISPNDNAMLFRLGKLYHDNKQYDLAINAYQKALGNERRPNQQTIEALKIIGEIYYTKLQDEKRALAFFRRYVKAGGKDTGVEFLIKRMTTKGS